MIPPLLAISVWPLISIAFFRTMRLPKAFLVTIIGGYLLLPEQTAFDLPLLPAFDKNSVPALSALVLAAIFGARTLTQGVLLGLAPRHWVAQALLVLLVVSSFMTVVTNPDPIFFPTLVLPGLRLYDAFSLLLLALTAILPMLMARRLLADSAGQRLLLVAFCVSALAYSLPALFEVRMSPQLNQWIYGFFPHSWMQHVRNGGFRPLVFLEHGLLLGILLCGAILATFGLMRLAPPQRRGLFLFAGAWLIFTLILSKNLGALFITVGLLPVVLFLGLRMQLLIAAIIAGVVVLYPLVRSLDVLPVQDIVTLADSFDRQRGDSFQTRLDNEIQVMAKINERPLFGWGPWGRNRVYDEEGRDVSILDGSWIIALGVSGWAGYVARFGLMALPIILLFLSRSRLKLEAETGMIAVLLAGNLIDLIPNSSATPLTWLLAGSLWGRLEMGRAVAPVAGALAAGPVGPALEPPLRQPGYRREDPSPRAEPPLPASADTDVAPSSHYTRQKTRITRQRSSSTKASG